MWGISLENSLVSKIFSKIMLAALCSSVTTVLIICTVLFATRGGWISKSTSSSREIQLSVFIFAFCYNGNCTCYCPYVNKKIVKPIEKMGGDLKHIDENCPYDELRPFAEKNQNSAR